MASGSVVEEPHDIGRVDDTVGLKVGLEQQQPAERRVAEEVADEGVECQRRRRDGGVDDGAPDGGAVGVRESGDAVRGDDAERG